MQKTSRLATRLQRERQAIDAVARLGSEMQVDLEICTNRMPLSEMQVDLQVDLQSPRLSADPPASRNLICDCGSSLRAIAIVM